MDRFRDHGTIAEPLADLLIGSERRLRQLSHRFGALLAEHIQFFLVGGSALARLGFLVFLLLLFLGHGVFDLFYVVFWCF